MRKIGKTSMVVTVLALLTLASTGFSAYTYLSMPKQIERYVQSHKDELKGDKGEPGKQGFTGMPGRDGADGADGSNGSSYTPSVDNSFSCRTTGPWYSGGSTYTRCN